MRPIKPSLKSMCHIWKHGMAIMLLSLFTAITAQAQSARGSITGHANNMATNASVKGAEVTIKGTTFATYTDQAGDYAFTAVPAGEATVVITYMGLTTQEKRVTVTPDGRATANFDMVPVDAPKVGDVINLEKFVVSAEKEGNARAFMEQKNNIGITQVVATDAYGNISTGNAAEFLKFLPGVMTTNDESEIRSISLGGMDPQYTGVTIDGAKLASSSGGSTGNDARTFQFQLMSSDAIESIEVDLLGGGDSPGGSVKMKTKGAFDQRGRKLAYDVFVYANSYYPNFSRSVGGGDEYTRKTKPGFRFSYSEPFFKNRLGFSLGLGRVSYYNVHDHMNLGYGNVNPSLDGSNDPQAGQPEILPFIHTINYKDANRVESKDTLFSKIDYKINNFGKIALTVNYAHVEQEFFNRSMTFGDNNQGGGGTAGTSTLTHVEGKALNANYTNQSANKASDTLSGNLRFDYKFGRFDFDALVGFSKATTTYEVATSDAPYFYNVNSSMSLATAWTADRPSPTSTSWIFTRTGTTDWNDPKNWTIGSMLARNTDAENQVLQVATNLKWNAPTKFPFAVILSLEGTTDKKHIMPDRYPETLKYTPPVEGMGITDFVSPYTANTHLGGNLGDLKLPYVDKSALYRAYLANPLLFSYDPATSNNWLKRQLQGYNDTLETLAAATLEITTRPLPRLDIQARLRYDYTDQEAQVMMLRSNAELSTAPYYFIPSQDANTREYIRAQFRDGERKTTTNGYTELMPSISARYKFTSNLMARVGYSTSIGRVGIGNISGAWSFGTLDGRDLATAPNPKLKPDIFNKVLFGLSYYVNAGEIGLLYSEQYWTGSATEAAYVLVNDGPEDSWDQALLATLRTTFGAEYIDGLITQGFLLRTLSDYNQTDRKVRQVALSFNQQLPFYKPVSVFGNVTRTMPSWIRTTANTYAAGGVSYAGRYIFARLKGSWWDRFRTGNVGAYNETWRKARLTLDAEFELKISKQFNLYFIMDNLTNSPSTTYYGKNREYITRSDKYGSKIIIGVKGNF